MNNLKPCPWCGGTHAVIETWSSGGAMYMVRCTNPDCRGDYPRGHDLKQVIEDWNRRTPNDLDT